jgi:[acyl-carrier-protein] S-malonyltransferase
MGKIAFVFSGREPMYIGMGKELYDSSPAARRVFDLADSIRKGTSEQCFYGKKEELRETKKHTALPLLHRPRSRHGAGRSRRVPVGRLLISLGEVSALAFSGAVFHRGWVPSCMRPREPDAGGVRTGGERDGRVLGMSNEAVETLAENFRAFYPVIIIVRGSSW